ncbi:unnamed protein product [Rhizophagus irregularis]|nr:unnamed protein product [Rhizophagus irregularis]
MKNVRIREKKYIRSPEKKELEDDLNEPIPQINTDSSRTRLAFKVQEIIFKRFQDAEDLNEPVILAFEIELDSRLVECIFPEFQPYVYDLEKIKKNFRQLINIFILLIEDGSGCATAYLGCTQQEDRRWHRPENLPVKRRSEARRYACMGNIILTIDPQQQRTKFYDNASNISNLSNVIITVFD